MVKFEGKYELEKSVNFVEYIRSLGQELSDEVAKKMHEGKTVLVVDVEGEEQYRFKVETSIDIYVFNFSIGKPFQEVVLGGILQNIAQREGNKINIMSTMNDKKYERGYEFSDHGVVETLQSPESKIVAKHHYKRV